MDESVEKARKVLDGQEKLTPQEALTLAEELHGKNHHYFAKMISARAREEAGDSQNIRLRLIRQEVLSTYKDPDLTFEKYDRSLEILRGEARLDRTKSREDIRRDLGTDGYQIYQDMLGIAGGIYKDKWEADGQKQNLENSLAYYGSGHEMGSTWDKGYTGINAAYVLDVLANLEEATMPEDAGTRRAKARRIREDLVNTLPKLVGQKPALERDWWVLVTVAEALFGLGRYEECLDWLNKAKRSQNERVADWMYETTARQLVSLARLQGIGSGSTDQFERSAPGRVLREFLGDDAAAVSSSFVGKVGLALSGGGFRAAFFHIGVLAKLAELGVLSRVEVLSCVSGGSIIGTHYYLEARKLLQEKRDEEITKEDYVAIVQRISKDFLDGVQRNIRMRVAAEPRSNLKMIFKRDYSRIKRIGELLEEQIFSRVQDGNGNANRWLNELLIEPADEGPPGSSHPGGEHMSKFSPRGDNWRRRAKVPVLILNATTLNTGHNWQFTASYMGESSASIDREIDANYHLRRKRYSDSPPTEMRLGYAVAASACVPGLFDSFVLDTRYGKDEESIVVNLVDGGVYDNQGIVSLLEQECNVLLVSDASGHMETEDSPGEGMWSVLLRSNNISMARVRAAQYRDLVMRQRSSGLRELMFVHLKKYLEGSPIGWVGREEDYEALRQTPGVLPSAYKVPERVQRRLANIRTDLDSFTDMEAHALMASGYLMTKIEANTSIKKIIEPMEDPPEWRFLVAREYMYGLQDSEDFMRVLDVASNRTFKIWRLSRSLRVATAALGVASAAGPILVGRKWWIKPAKRWFKLVFTDDKTALKTASMVASLTLLPLGVRDVLRRSTLSRTSMGLGMGTLGWIAARVQLHLLDRWYLSRGRWRKNGPARF